MLGARAPSSLIFEENFMNRPSLDLSALDLSALGLTGLSRALAGAARGIGILVRSVPAQALQWHERRKGLESLRALTDHQLRDIGLRRAEIVLAAYGLHDPHEASRMVTAAGAASRAVPATKKADNSDENPCIGCAA
jgi:uncharacterized protein YjiS (DUF1127 family)